MAGRRVESVDGLVGEDQPQAVDERPGDRNALLLAAGNLIRDELSEAREADAREHLRRPTRALIASDACVEERRRHVVDQRLARQQVVSLEDEADDVVAELGELIAVERAHVAPVQRVAPAGRQVETRGYS